MKKLAVLTSGGDAPGMNAAVRAVVRRSADRGVGGEGVRRGFAGLLAREFLPLGPREVGNILQRGGTFLGTSRPPEMKSPQGRKQAVQALREEGIQGLVVIGGDGSPRAAHALSREGGAGGGGPATIDNDLYG